MTQTAKLTASDGAADDDFGSSVSISGNTVVVGADGATVGGNSYQGAAYVFTEPGSGWANMTRPPSSPRPMARRTTISAARFRSAATRWWSEREMPRSAATAARGRPTCSRSPAPVGRHDPDRQAHRVRWRGGRLFRQLGFDQRQHGGGRSDGATVGGNSYQGAAYVFTEPGSGWTQTAKLTASDGEPDDDFGSSVSISGNTVVVGAYGATVGANSRQGAAYVFATPVQAPPEVTNVVIDSTAWNSTFLSYLASLGSQNVGGYSIPWAAVRTDNVALGANVSDDEMQAAPGDSGRRSSTTTGELGSGRHYLVHRTSPLSRASQPT